MYPMVAIMATLASWDLTHMTHGPCRICLPCLISTWVYRSIFASWSPTCHRLTPCQAAVLPSPSGSNLSVSGRQTPATRLAVPEHMQIQTASTSCPHDPCLLWRCGCATPSPRQRLLPQFRPRPRQQVPTKRTEWLWMRKHAGTQSRSPRLERETHLPQKHQLLSLWCNKCHAAAC